MTVRQDFLSFIMQDTLETAELDIRFLTDIFDTIHARLQNGRMLLIEGSLTDVMTVEALIFSDKYPKIKTCRFDFSLWEPRLVIAVSSNDANAIISMTCPPEVPSL